MTRRTSILTFLLLLAGIPSVAQEDFSHPELDWKTLESKHFYVHFHDGAERTARVVAKIAEEIYGPVTSLYNHVPDQRVSFVIKDYDDYSNGAAYFYDNKIEIWASALDFDLRGTHNWLRNVISHEFTHIIQIQTSMKFGRRVPAFYLQWLGYEEERRPDVLYGFPNVIVSYPVSGFNVPSWFAEGVAQYSRRELDYDHWDAHRDMILRMYALDGNMLTWNQMSVFGKTSLGNESSYNAGFAFVSYIAERFGEEKIPEISRNLSSLTEVTIDGAIKRAVGIDGKDLYDEWRAHLQQDYASRMSGVLATRSRDTIVGGTGFANFYPTFAPDGKSFAYISNKNADYFSQSSIYLYDLTTHTERLLVPGVRSAISWSPDGKKIYFSRITRNNPHWSNLSDMYVYNLETEETDRLTHGARGHSVAVSPDGSRIAFVAGSDGTQNIVVAQSDGSNIRQVTLYANGEQVFNPRWSPDGASILFDYSLVEGRDIAIVPAEGGEVRFLIATADDERNGTYTPDGSAVLFSSDRTGVFNLYRYDLKSASTVQLTNVAGGAFMGAVNERGMVLFSSYTSTGYKIALMDSVAGLPELRSYERITRKGLDQLVAGKSGRPDMAFDWQSLRAFDDSKYGTAPAKEYPGVASSLSIVPFLRIDNYNKKNKGIDVIKPGVYAYSFDVIDRYGFFAGAAINRKMERDLFLNFEYHGAVPGFYQLGLEPAVHFDVYNLVRKTDSYLTLPLDTIGVEVSYNLLQFELGLGQKLFTEALDAEVRFSHSRYTASIGSFILPDVGAVVQSFGDLYYIGNILSATLTLNDFVPSRTMEINPVGRKIRLRYEYEFSKFNPSNEYEVKDGLLVPQYERPRFHRMEMSWRESRQLPGWRHTLSGTVGGGTIFGPPVDNFFDFYIGGLTGMKGYPFYSISGNSYLTGNLTYRFPLVENLDFRFMQIYFDKLYAAVYGDVGAAWTEGGVKGQRFRKDIGIELRLESFSYYAYPTRFFFNATYGFDRFDRYVENFGRSVTYGKEWVFHFGILFDFDLGTDMKGI